MNQSRLDAWIHWKELELKKYPDEDDNLFLQAIKEIKAENKRLRGALEKIPDMIAAQNTRQDAHDHVVRFVAEVVAKSLSGERE